MSRVLQAFTEEMRKAGAAKIQHDLSKRKFMLVFSFPPPHTLIFR